MEVEAYCSGRVILNNKTFSVDLVVGGSILENRLLREILSNNPSLHAFTLHDIRNDRSRTDLYIASSTDSILGYLLIYRGIKRYHSAIIELFRDIDWMNIIRALISSTNIVRRGFTGTIHIDKRYVETVADFTKPDGIYYYYIMEKTGEPPLCEPNQYDVIELDRRVLDKYEASYEVARRIRGLRKPYGVLINNRIAGVGGFYVTEPEVYLVGGIYVEPDYRGRGIGKAISCFLTRKALEYTNRVVLWVNTENKPAVHIYDSIEYRVIRVNAWVNINVNVKP